MKIVCGALAALLFCVAGAIWYVYQKKAVFLPALFGLCGFPKIKESCYYDGSGHFRPATKEDKVGFFMQHPIFGGFYHMFFNLEDNALKAIAPAKYKDFMQAQGRAEQTDTALDAFNYLTGLVEKGQAKLVSGLYPQEAMKDHPDRSHLTGMFYYGQPGKPLAIVVPGGGFISNVTDCEGYPIAMELHKMGYSVFVLSYPIGKQLGETEPLKQGQAAAKELTQAIRYLTNHQKELAICMDDYAIFGFSAGELMTTAYSFASYADCCHNHHLPRPKAIFPMYGLDCFESYLPYRSSSFILAHIASQRALSWHLPPALFIL